MKRNKEKELAERLMREEKRSNTLIALAHRAITLNDDLSSQNKQLLDMLKTKNVDEAKKAKVLDGLKKCLENSCDMCSYCCKDNDPTTFGCRQLYIDAYELIAGGPIDG